MKKQVVHWSAAHIECYASAFGHTKFMADNLQTILLNLKATLFTFATWRSILFHCNKTYLQVCTQVISKSDKNNNK